MFYIRSYPWKWVCSQHPMILISRDQTNPRALETVPPWGGEDIHGYCVKMYEMLVKVLDTPEMKIDFDLSAKELLIFFEEIEDGKRIMKQLIAEGRLGFVGGDYAQAHYHEARSESALRQLRMGMRVFTDELNYVIDTFQHQETGLFENLPQLLKALGIKKSAIHTFVSTFEFLDAPSLEILSNFGRLELVHRESFASWCGLDGSSLPIYLPIVQNHLPTGGEVHDVFDRFINDPDYRGIRTEPPQAYHKYPTAYEETRGLYHNASIIVECPDLISLDDQYIEDRKRVGSFYLMSEALDEELRLQTRLPKIHYYTYWSYCEGQFGEKMFKGYRTCEERLLAAETMQVIAEAIGAHAGCFDADMAWDKLLTAQHHDVNWIDTDELKTWALAEMQQAQDEADSYIDAVAEAAISACGTEPGDFVAVFNTLPVRRRALAQIPVDDAGYQVVDGNEELLSQIMNGNLCFYADMDGLGVRSYGIARAKMSSAEPQPITDAYQFENDAMTVVVLKDGRIQSLCSKSSGERLASHGNLIQGQLVSEDKSARWISNEDEYASASVVKGALFDIISVNGHIGPLPYRMRVYLPHGNAQQIDFDLDIDFDHTAIGDFYHDESKLNLYWNTCQQAPRILIDEPFGITPWRSDRPIHAANFVALTEEGKGVVYTHYGTPKSYATGGTLANVIAWGGNNFTNRGVWGWSGMDIFDMRLVGTSHYHYNFGIVEKEDASALCANANSNITPFITHRSDARIDPVSLLTLANPNLVPTAVEKKDGRTTVRVYDVLGAQSQLKLASQIGTPERTDIAGKHLEGLDIQPYEVFELRF